jgi:hypothetical protein
MHRAKEQWNTVVCTLLIALLSALIGCNQEPSADIKARAAELSSGFKKHAEVIGAKQDESLTILREQSTALAAIKSQIEALKVQSETVNSQEVIKSALEPQEPERDPNITPSISVSASAVRLYVTHAPFHCPPCERLKQAVSNGEFDGFEVTDSGDFSGLRSYPAIRFETPSTSTGWGVVYGYDNSTIPTLRALTQEVPASQPVGAIFPLSRQSAIVSSKTTFRPVSYGSRFVGRSRVTTRAACPACPR